MTLLFRLALQPHIVRNAVRVSVFVGTILNIINQGDALWSNHAVSWPHVFLNYLVPYCVASYSAAKNEAQRRDSEAPPVRDE